MILAIGTSSYALFLGASNSDNASQQSTVNLSKGLVGEWKLNGNAKDSTPYQDNGTAANITWAQDREGTASAAASYSSATSSVLAPNAAQLDIAGDVTLSAWVYPTTLSFYASNSNEIVVTKRTDASQVPYELKIGSDGSIHAGWAVVSGGDGGWTGIGVSNKVVLNEWQLLTFTRTSSQACIYVNGVSAICASTTGLGAAIPGSEQLNIGGVTSQYSGFIGSIDDVRIYNRALSPAEATALYTQYNPSVNLDSGQSGLVGEWKCNGNVKDSTPYQENGTITGGVTYTTDWEGQANSACNFDGSSQTKITTSGASLPAGQSAFSITAWVYPTSYPASGYDTITSWGGTTTHNNEMLLGIAANGTLRADGDFNGCASASATVSLNAWHFVSFTFPGNGSTAGKLYVDGVSYTCSFYDSESGSFTPPDIGVGQHYIGDLNTSSYYWVGKIGDVRIYNRALSTSEVANLYASYNSQVNLQSSPTNNTTVNLNTGLVGYWPFNGNLKDATPYQNNVLLNGSPQPTLVADRRARASSALNTTGLSTYQAYVRAAPSQPSHQITVSAWVNQSACVNWNDWVYSNWQGSDPTYSGWMLLTNSVCQVNFGLWGGVRGSGQANAYGSNCIMTNNSWHLLTGTYDGSTVRAYMDGQLCSVSVSVSNAVFDTAKAIDMLSSPTGNADTIDDVRIYNRALSSTEVQALYNTYY